MIANPQSRWFGVRAIYHFDTKQDGTNVFEERIVVFSAASADEALAKAEREAHTYATDRECPMERHPLLEAYEQVGHPLIDGYEVWSTMFESRESLASFVASKYERYEYHPEP